MTAPASAALHAKLSLLAPALGSASTDLWRTAAPRPRYLAYLRGMYDVLRASVPLLERAARRCAELPPGDPTAAPLARYYARHAEEERGHDIWLLEDLAAAATGLPVAAFRTVREHAALDGGHLADLAELLDALPLTPGQQAAVGANAIRSADLLIQLFRRLARTGSSQGEP